MNSASGRIESAWKLEGDELSFQFVVPFDTEAEIVLPDAQAEAIRAQCAGLNVKGVRQAGGDTVLTVGAGRFTFRYAPTSPYRKVYSLDSSWADIKAKPEALEIVMREFQFKEDHIPFETELCTLREMSWSPFTSMTQAQRDTIDAMLREVR